MIVSRGHYARVCKLKKDEKGKDDKVDKADAHALDCAGLFSLSYRYLVNPFYEEPDGVAVELLEKHLLSMTAVRRVDHGRFLGHTDKR